MRQTGETRIELITPVNGQPTKNDKESKLVNENPTMSDEKELPISQLPSTTAILPQFYDLPGPSNCAADPERTVKPITPIQGRSRHNDTDCTELIAKTIWENLPKHDKCYKLSQQFSSCSMKNIILQYNINNGDRLNAETFLKYAADILKHEFCEMLAEETFYQGFNRVWLVCRYGRLTIHDFYAAATDNLSKETFEYKCLINYGTISFPESHVFDVEKKEREQLIKIIRTRTGDRTIDKSGIVLSTEYPFLMAAPDAICETAIVHIRHGHAETFDSYQKVGDVSQKDRVNLQMEMLVCKKALGYYCLVHPNFEMTHEVKILEEDADVDFIEPLVATALYFWTKEIFPILQNNYH